MSDKVTEEDMEQFKEFLKDYIDTGIDDTYVVMEDLLTPRYKGYTKKELNDLRDDLNSLIDDKMDDMVEVLKEAE